MSSNQIPKKEKQRNKRHIKQVDFELDKGKRL